MHDMLAILDADVLETALKHGFRASVKRPARNNSQPNLGLRDASLGHLRCLVT
jgi:hypothetical protein